MNTLRLSKAANAHLAGRNCRRGFYLGSQSDLFESEVAVKNECAPGMASARYASYIEEEDWDISTLQLVNSHLESYLTMVG